MAAENDGKKKDYFIRSFRLTIVSGFLISVIVLLFKNYVTDNPTKELLNQIGFLLVGAFSASFINEVILGNYYKHQNREMIIDTVDPGFAKLKETLSKSINEIVPNVEKQTKETVLEMNQKIQKDTSETLGYIKTKIEKATDVMVNGIDVLSGAKAAGIANIFPRRYKNKPGMDNDHADNKFQSVMDIIANDITVENAFIKIMGISLGDYFLDRGNLHEPLMNILQNKNELNIETLIVHPKSMALGERARWEAKANNNNDFFVSTTFIETDGSARISKKLCQEYKNLHVRLYSQAPTAFVLLTSRYAFIEPYTYAARGSSVPVFQVQASSDLYREYLVHYTNIWNAAMPIEQYDPLNNTQGPFEH